VGVIIALLAIWVTSATEASRPLSAVGSTMDAVVGLGGDTEVLAADVVVDRAAVGVDESLPRVTNTVTATAITTSTRAPMASRPHRRRFGGCGAGGGYGPGA
jgi:hypothetical protein